MRVGWSEKLPVASPTCSSRAVLVIKWVSSKLVTFKRACVHLLVLDGTSSPGYTGLERQKPALVLFPPLVASSRLCLSLGSLPPSVQRPCLTCNWIRKSQALGNYGIRRLLRNTPQDANNYMKVIPGSSDHPRRRSLSEAALIKAPRIHFFRKGSGKCCIYSKRSQTLLEPSWPIHLEITWTSTCSSHDLPFC